MLKSRDEIIRILVRPFPQEALKSRQGGGGKMFTYIEGHTAIHRLNEATGNNWSFEIINMPPMILMGENKQKKQQFLVTVHGRLFIPELGSRDDVGVQMITLDGGEDLYKGAVRDCLKRCASNFGMALELYGEHYEAPAPVQPNTKRQLAAEYERTTGNALTKELWEKEIKERFNTTPDTLLDDDVQPWLLDLRAQATYTAPTEEKSETATPLADAVKKGRTRVTA